MYVSIFASGPSGMLTRLLRVPSQPTTVQSSPADETKNAILETGRLFLRNLAFSCTEDELLELFSPFGQVSQVRITSIFAGDVLAFVMTK